MSRLRQRVEKLEHDKGDKRMVVVVAEVNETAEKAQARHFAEHPEDRSAGNVLTVQLVDPTRDGEPLDVVMG